VAAPMVEDGENGGNMGTKRRTNENENRGGRLLHQTHF